MILTSFFMWEQPFNVLSQTHIVYPKMQPIIEFQFQELIMKKIIDNLYPIYVLFSLKFYLLIKLYSLQIHVSQFSLTCQNLTIFFTSSFINDFWYELIFFSSWMEYNVCHISWWYWSTKLVWWYIWIYGF